MTLVLLNALFLLQVIEAHVMKMKEFGLLSSSGETSISFLASFNTRSRSKLECSSYCLQESHCNSFGFEAEEKNCHLQVNVKIFAHRGC